MPVKATHLRVIPDQPKAVMATSPSSVGAIELEVLFREHYDRIFRAAYRITGSTLDAEDVLQTVFLRLARRSEAPDLSPSPAAYLTRAAINASLDIVRARGMARSVSLDEVEPRELMTSQKQSPESLHADRELLVPICVTHPYFPLFP